MGVAAAGVRVARAVKELRGKTATSLLLAAGVLATVVLLIHGLGYPGVIMSAAVVAIGGFFLSQRGSEQELCALRRSIEHSSSDIARILQQWERFHSSCAAEKPRGRIHHQMQLLNPECCVDSVREFHQTVRAAEEFLNSLHGRVQASTSVAALTTLLRDTDRLAAQLDSLWTRARRESGTVPGV